MSLASELSIKPGPSKVYLRFITICYLFTLILIVYSSLHCLIQICCIFFLAYRCKIDYKLKSPCPHIQELKWVLGQWSILDNNGIQHYDDVSVLIQNPIFHVLRTTCKQKKKVIILFNDQVHRTHIRFLHLKSTKN